MGTSWTRSGALEELHAFLWRYLSPSAEVASVESLVEDVWQLSSGELRRLAATHVALDPITEKMLHAAPSAIRRLRSSVQRRTSEEIGRVTGPVVWDRTAQRRLQTGEGTLFVTRPVERQYDTPEARLVLLCLRACAELSDLSELGSSDAALGARIATLSRTSRHLMHHVKLENVTEVRSFPERVLETLGRRGYQPFVDYWRLFRDAVLSVRHHAVIDVVSRRVLAPASDEDVFELLVGFRLLAQFELEGFNVRFGGLVPGGKGVFAAAARDDVQLSLWWQRAPWRVISSWDHDDSFYGSMLTSAGLTRSTLRPDFVIEVKGTRSQVLLIEVKHTSREGFAPDRAGVVDALAYLQDAGPLLRENRLPHVLVVAQNSTASPSLSSVVVTGPDRLDETVRLLLSAWSAPTSRGAELTTQ